MIAVQMRQDDGVELFGSSACAFSADSAEAPKSTTRVLLAVSSQKQVL